MRYFLVVIAAMVSVKYLKSRLCRLTGKPTIRLRNLLTLALSVSTARMPVLLKQMNPTPVRASATSYHE